jgi:hypothetical protein
MFSLHLCTSGFMPTHKFSFFIGSPENFRPCHFHSTHSTLVSMVTTAKIELNFTGKMGLLIVLTRLARLAWDNPSTEN